MFGNTNTNVIFFNEKFMDKKEFPKEIMIYINKFDNDLETLEPENIRYIPDGEVAIYELKEIKVKTTKVELQ